MSKGIVWELVYVLEEASDGSVWRMYILLPKGARKTLRADHPAWIMMDWQIPGPTREPEVLCRTTYCFLDGRDP